MLPSSFLRFEARSGAAGIDTVNFVGGAFIQTSAADGSIENVNFTTAVNSFSGSGITVNESAATMISSNLTTIGTSAISITTSGAIAINGAMVSTASGAIKLATGVGGTFTAASTGTNAVFSSGGNITIAADSMVINGPIDASNGIVTLEQATTSTRNIDLGGGTTSGDLNISDAALGEITAQVVRIGRTDNAGSITVTAAVSFHSGYNILHLFTSAGISQTLTGAITVSQLAIDATDRVGLDTDANSVGTLAANGSYGDIYFQNAGSLTIGTVDGDIGVNDTNRTVMLTAVGVNSDLTLAANVKSGSSTVDLRAGRNITLSASVTLTGTFVTLESPLLGNGNDLTVISTISDVGTLSVSGASIYADISTTKTQTYAGAVSLSGSGNVVLSSSGTGSNGDITFASVQSAGAMHDALTVNTAGTTTFGGAVGSNFLPLASLTTDAGGTTQINGGSVTTTAGQSYNDNVTLSGNTTLTGTSVDFGGTVQSQIDRGNLTIAGNAVFGGGVGGSGVDMNNLHVTGTTTINTTGVETLGNQTYIGAVTLGANTVLSSISSGNITLASTVQSPSTANSLTINSASIVTFGGAVGGTGTGNQLGALTVGGGGITQINGGSINTTGSTQTYNDNVTLGSASTILAGIVDFNTGLTLGTSATTATSKLQIAGTLNFTNTTTLTTTFTGTGASQFGFIVVGGGNTNYGNATLAVNYVGFTPVAGDSFDVVSNGGFGIGQFVNAPSPGIFSFGGVKYSAVYNGSAGGGDFIMTAISANEAVIEALYQSFLGRPGLQAEWDGWVGVLTSMGRAPVVNGIEYSSEALNRLVNELYLRYLNRSASDPGAKYWVNLLAEGVSEEQVSAGLLASPEFAGDANTLIGTTDSNYNFVEALYKVLLNRTSDTVGVNYWLGELNSGALSRGDVAWGLQTSTEYRSGAVETFYGDTSLPVFPYQPFFPDFLHRTPAASEVTGWAGSQQALLQIEASFAVSDEFYNDNA